MGLNEVAIGIAPPGFAIELARSRLHPSWLSRTVTTGEMYEPDDALIAGLLDCVVPQDSIDAELDAAVASLRAIHRPSHAVAKKRLRQPTMDAMRERIDTRGRGLKHRAASDVFASPKIKQTPPQSMIEKCGPRKKHGHHTLKRR